MRTARRFAESNRLSQRLTSYLGRKRASLKTQPGRASSAAVLDLIRGHLTQPKIFSKIITASERLRTFCFVKCQTNSAIRELFAIGSHLNSCFGSWICEAGMSASSRNGPASSRALCPRIFPASGRSGRIISLLISEYSIARSARCSSTPGCATTLMAS